MVSEGLSTWRGERDAPLIHDGIDPPVRNPMQSFVKELQLKSTRSICMRELSFVTDVCAEDPYPRGDTAPAPGQV